jgi:hypothetical protein
MAMQDDKAALKNYLGEKAEVKVEDRPIDNMSA